MSVQATLDSIARRLLTEELQGNPSQPSTRTDDSRFKGVSDDRPPLVSGEPIPVVHAHGQDTGAAA